MKYRLMIFLIFFIAVTGCTAANIETSQPLQPTPTQTLLPTATQQLLPPPTDAPTPTKEENEGVTDPVVEADIIFHNGVILTMNPAQPQVQAIAIRGEEILGVGSDSDILPLAGSKTQKIDLQGRTLMPGFVDAHNHVYANTERSSDGMRQTQDWLLSLGITTTAEAGVDDGLLYFLVRENSAGNIRVRSSLYLLHIDNCGIVLGNWYTNHPSAHLWEKFLRVPGIKVFTDGGSCNVPAVSFEYPFGGKGDLYFEPVEFSRHIIAAQEEGYQVVSHALGDRAAEMTLEAIRIALGGSPNTLRHRIEHSGLLRDELLPRFGEIGVVPVIFGKFPACYFRGDTSKFKYLSPLEYRHWEWRYADLIAASPGLPYAWHSDYPVFESINPFEHLFGFVTRKEITPDGQVCDPEDWAADDRIPVADALQMMTANAAYAVFYDDVTGSLETGKFADMIILSENPLEVESDELINISVLMTMVGGKVEYCAENLVCPQNITFSQDPGHAITVGVPSEIFLPWVSR